jgi:hypothetical protein
MDSGLTDLVEAIVEWIDERFGRPAAWLAAIVGLIAIIAVPFAIVLYLLL